MSRLISVIVVILLLSGCRVQQEEEASQARGLGEAGEPQEVTSVLYAKYAYTNEKTKKRVIQILKIDIKQGRGRPPKVTSMEAINPADQSPVEVIVMGEPTVQENANNPGTFSSIQEGKDSADNIYLMEITYEEEGKFFFEPTITTKHGDKLVGEVWDRHLTSTRWEKHVKDRDGSPATGGSTLAPATEKDVQTLISTCYDSNTSYSGLGSDGYHTFTYSVPKCGYEEFTVKYKHADLRGISGCLRSCGVIGGYFSFRATGGLDLSMDCNSEVVTFEYDKNGIKLTSEDEDGLVDVYYGDDCI